MEIISKENFAILVKCLFLTLCSLYERCEYRYCSSIGNIDKKKYFRSTTEYKPLRAEKMHVFSKQRKVI